MKVFYSFYSLHSLKKANRLSSEGKKSGVLLKAELSGKTIFADYFPHLPLGDKNCEEFLDSFKFQEKEYERKVFDLLLKDSDFQGIRPKHFFNHQLWSESERLEAPVIKYKIQHEEDYGFLKILQISTARVRLDANGLFTRETFHAFSKEVSGLYKTRIDYLEDPFKETNWEDLDLKAARDFIEGNPFDFYIYKPNCEFMPSTDKDIIFSAYLGSSLGSYHAYCELIQKGNLNLTHGIFTQGFYEEEIKFLQGTYQDGFISAPDKVKEIYKNTSDRSWKLLCSM